MLRLSRYDIHDSAQRPRWRVCCVTSVSPIQPAGRRVWNVRLAKLRRIDMSWSNKAKRLLTSLAVLCLTAGCSEVSRFPDTAGMGVSPQLPSPSYSRFVPTVNIAPAKGWPSNAQPTAGTDLSVNAFSRDLQHPRWLYVLPNGDVLVAESNAPAKEGAPASIKRWAMKWVMKRAGAGTPSPDRISLLRDADGDGVAETRTIFLQGLHSPFGMALVDKTLYVANTDALVRFPYNVGDTQITAPAVKVSDLPAGKINHHWTKNVIASNDGAHLYVTVGSNSNVGENGMENEVNRAAILEIDAATGRSRIFASGLRNPNGLAWQPRSNVLWTTVNERDEMGNDLVPDYLTSVRENGFYGWPYSYFGRNIDARVTPQRPELVASAIVPDYALGAHTGSLGLLFYEGELLPQRFKGGALVAQHGSWNRKPRSGYKVIFIPFDAGRPAGLPENVLTDFVSASGEAYGRPVGLAMDRAGALLVADDVGNVVWRVQSSGSQAAQ